MNIIIVLAVICVLLWFLDCQKVFRYLEELDREIGELEEEVEGGK